MLRGLWQLTWLEIKIFLREPLGAIGSVVFPVAGYVILGRLMGPRAPARGPESDLLRVGVPVLFAIMIALTSLISLVTIISIYREGGILKRLRATPLRPWTILSAHVVVKLLLTALTMTAMILAGKRYFTIGPAVPIVSFSVALLVATLSILSIGFIVASVVPTA